MLIQRDDQYSRTATSLLSLIRLPDYTLYVSTVPAGPRNYFKLMLAPSFLLARGAEVVASILKCSVEEITLFFVCQIEGSSGRNICAVIFWFRRIPYQMKPLPRLDAACVWGMKL